MHMMLHCKQVAVHLNINFLQKNYSRSGRWHRQLRIPGPYSSTDAPCAVVEVDCRLDHVAVALVPAQVRLQRQHELNIGVAGEHIWCITAVQMQ